MKIGSPEGGCVKIPGAVRFHLGWGCRRRLGWVFWIRDLSPAWVEWILWGFLWTWRVISISLSQTENGQCSRHKTHEIFARDPTTKLDARLEVKFQTKRNGKKKDTWECLAEEHHIWREPLPVSLEHGQYSKHKTPEVFAWLKKAHH